MAKKILVVDDSPLATEMIASMLMDEGHEVVICNDPLEAAAKAASEDPDLVVLDTLMPGLSGFEVCQRIRAAAAGSPRPKIVMTTGSIDAVDAVKARKAGTDEYVVKTADLVLLKDAVAKLLA